VAILGHAVFVKLDEVVDLRHQVLHAVLLSDVELLVVDHAVVVDNLHNALIKFEVLLGEELLLRGRHRGFFCIFKLFTL
jgi:hypothetical protein